MENDPFRIVQISDIHLFAEQEKVLLGVKTHDSFNAAIQLLKTDSTPDLILLSGDLSQDGSDMSYIKVADKLKGFAIPTYYVPGNHDDPETLASIYPRETITHHRHIVLKNWHLILLNSQKVNAVEGFLDDAQLQFLQHCLEMFPEHHAIVVFHHQPVPVGSAWLDNIGLTNADALWSVLAHFPKMHTILFGHVHQEHAGEKNGIRYFSAPSTCIQFKRGSDVFALEKLPPGYRWIDLYSDGRLETGIRRAPGYVGEFDENAKGY
ncbi:MAG TPA: 3',5'-cyclic-AMP phosphodiesterase [Gammaproteobacteria bacterium]|nr:3',5'-cyclic-AMP phosphodiesterase [Gammaproteobacteria bacterium]